MKRKSLTIWMMVVLRLCSVEAWGAWGDVYFNDGQVHDIDYSFSSYRTTVWNSNSGCITTLNILDGAWFPNTITAWDESIINVLGGSMEGLGSYGKSQLTVSGGEFRRYLSVSHYSNATISGGVISRLNTRYNGQVTISGGTIKGQRESEYSIIAITVKHHSQVTITGGLIEEGSVIAGNQDEASNALITVVGTDFTFKGEPVDYGELYIPPGRDPRGGILTGTLLDGSYLNTNFYVVGDAKIVLTPIPEPTTLLLLGLGAVMLRRKRKA